MLYTFLESNHIQFSFQLMISEFAFLIGRPKRDHFSWRLVLGMAGYFFLADLWEALLWDRREQALFFHVILYFGYAAMTAVLACFCYEIRMTELLFIVTGGYAAEHMCFSAFWILAWLCRLEDRFYGYLPYLLITRYLIYALSAIAVYFFLVRKNQDVNYGDGDRRIVMLSSVLLFAAVGLSVYWSYSNTYSRTGIVGIVCPAYSFLCSVLVLLMEYYVLRENDMKREREMMSRLIQMADVQQKSAKEAIDIINIKCHDLKHQIGALAKMEDAKERSEYIREVQGAISVYDAIYHTGNKALDYILREKTLLFNEYQIQFSCMVEGEITLFIEPTDMYALMGNALDNALEQVMKESEEERFISFHIKSCGKMTLVHLENRCSVEPQFRDGFPVTSKKDRNSHGFGVKSMRYITEKYQGELVIRTGGGRFLLDILFPHNSDF